MARLNGACYREAAEEVIGRVRRWEAELAKVEWLMAEVGRGMRVLTPNRPGRLIVRWWKRRGWDDACRPPVLLRLAVRGGASVLEPVGPNAKPMGTGYFKTTRQELLGLLVVWWRLVEVREWLLGELGGLGRVKPGRRMEVFAVVALLSVEVDSLVEMGRRKVSLMRGDGLEEWESEEEVDGAG